MRACRVRAPLTRCAAVLFVLLFPALSFPVLCPDHRWSSPVSIQIRTREARKRERYKLGQLSSRGGVLALHEVCVCAALRREESPRGGRLYYVVPEAGRCHAGTQSPSVRCSPSQSQFRRKYLLSNGRVCDGYPHPLFPFRHHTAALLLSLPHTPAHHNKQHTLPPHPHTHPSLSLRTTPKQPWRTS